MRKYIALVLLLSFIGLLWAHEDTCLQTENATTNIDEECTNEQTNDVHEEQLGNLKRQNYSGDSLIILNDYNDLLQYVPKANFLYTQEYFTSEQDTTEIIGSDGCLKFLDRYACCAGTVVIILGCVIGLMILAASVPYISPY